MKKWLKKVLLFTALLTAANTALADTDQLNYFVLTPKDSIGASFEVLQAGNSSGLPWIQSPMCSAIGCVGSLRDEQDGAPGWLILKIGQKPAQTFGGQSNPSSYCVIMANVYPSKVVITGISGGFGSVTTYIPASTNLLSFSFCTPGLGLKSLKTNSPAKLLLRIFKTNN